MKTTLALFAILFAAACAFASDDVPQSASEVDPLKVGDHIPAVTLHTATGDPFRLREAVMEQRTVIIFYRGGWCPYCNRHLAAMQLIEDQLLEKGFRILAISPDRPEKMNETAAKNEVSYQLLSDSSMAAARAFGIAFQLDDATVKKYKEKYKIDIEADSGQTHHQLPVPAVFIANTNGKIVFRHFNPDYKQRLDPDVLLGATEMLTHKSKKF